ncbi:hypothetical protein BDW02DRAFT_991 [Decorospora gaudefroyi]|uniref:Uncharacterized protein n=1 Tax=Decorospora gaudefroyi TaxID=184978 RepID=A0A6A5KW34_9PLEO|nr:hypothetical protein BDW02DRAFT_991 [Decorospora gaudefroyi]
MLPLLAPLLLASLHLSNALPNPQATTEDTLIILDKGVGHRSTPVPRWRTSLRRLSPRGTNATILTQFEAATNATQRSEPINAYALTYSASTSTLFSATGQGIIRTATDGSDATLILQEDSSEAGLDKITSVHVAEKEQKIYYGTQYQGLIKKADLDGSNVEIVLNVSQGLNLGFASPSYKPAKFYAGGIVVDEETGWLYWSAARGDKDGSIRRAALKGTDGGEEQHQVLASGINMPGQVRIVGGSLYWVERGRWSNSPTAIKYLDRALLALPATGTSAALATGTLVHASQSALFFEKDYTGERQTLGIQSFVVDRREREMRVWFVVESSGRTMFGKLVRVGWRGGGRGPVFEVLNEDTREVGVPVGLEFLR